MRSARNAPSCSHSASFRHGTSLAPMARRESRFSGLERIGAPSKAAARAPPASESPYDVDIFPKNFPGVRVRPSWWAVCHRDVGLRTERGGVTESRPRRAGVAGRAADPIGNRRGWEALLSARTLTDLHRPLMYMQSQAPYIKSTDAQIAFFERYLNGKADAFVPRPRRPWSG